MRVQLVLNLTTISLYLGRSSHTMADHVPVHCVVECRTILAVMASDALVRGGKRRLLGVTLFVGKRRSMASLAPNANPLGTSKCRNEATRRTVPGGVTLLAKRIDIIPPLAQRFPCVRVPRVG